MTVRICGRKATFLARSYNGRLKKAVSSIIMCPAVTLALELRQERRVVFPQPLGPMIVVISPLLNFTLIFFSI